MNTKLYSWLAVVTLVIAIIACFLPFGGKTIIDRTLGANPGTSFSSDCYNWNGTDVCTTSMNLTTATGTIAYWKTPFFGNATSTVDLADLTITTSAGATLGLVAYNCGTTTVVGATPSASLINSGNTGTSTLVKLTNGSVGVWNSNNGNARIEVKPTEYVACFITVTNSGSVTVASSAIAGTLKLRAFR